MLQPTYKEMINKLIEFTNQNKIHWIRDDDNPDAFFISPNADSKILLDNYYSQFDNTVNSCINMTIFELPSNKILDEIVICNAADQVADFALVNKLYQLAKKQYSDTGLNATISAITKSLK